MTDRTVTYTQAIPRSQDFLQTQKYTLTSIAYLAQAILGQPSILGDQAWLDGLLCAPVSPAGLQVTVGAGSIYMMEEMDANPYGVLGVDTSILLKQGLLLSPAVLNIAPPSTSGYSQYYVIEVNYNDTDGGNTVLPYFNAANPLIPLGGPANTGQQQFTVRQGLCVVSLKPGVAAPSGTQVIPASDAGFTPIWTVLVVNGQTQITSANIAQVANAPFISPKLTQVPPAIQAQVNNFAVDTGLTANAMAITLPSYTSVVQGLTLRVQKSALKNTSSPTLSINGATPVTIAWSDGNALQAGDWPAGGIGQITYNGSSWELYTIAGPSIFARVAPGSSPTVTDASLWHYGVDTGSANAASCGSVAPAITSSVTVGTAFEVQKIAQSNTGSMSFSATATAGTVTASLYWPDGNALQAGDWPAGALALIVFDGTYYRLMSVSNRPVTFPQGAYVHYGVAAGTNTLTTTTTPNFTAMTDGVFLELTPTSANTGPVTLAANGLTPAAIQTVTGNNLASGQLQPGQPILLMALGGVWKLFLGGVSGGGGITNIQVLTSSGAYVPTAGAQKALALVTGGGGAGGVQYSCGGGGGAGGTAIALVSLTGVSSISFTIGAGGAGVAASGNGSSNGGDGGTTTFGSYAAAAGGQGGQRNVGGLGGNATLGAMLIKGGEGTRAIDNAILGSGPGGSSFWGGGGQGAPTTSGQGDDGCAYGSGGGGGDSGYSIKIGGNGKAGVILVLEF
jgi:hypothetical protein